MKKASVLSVLTLLVAAVLAAALFSSFLGGRVSREALDLAENSIRRAAVQCYALEGFYPPDLDYLTGRYGVSVDTQRYFVDYQYVASNLMPDITVLSLQDLS